jgi:nitroimidazol reductase NimA-like FMN-containing flavoprotein (pyridoxamine 5'-phosphate oxidase superfamily)
MATMTDDERDAFMLEPRLGNLAISRTTRGPLVAPIWYRYAPGGTVDICMNGDSAKAKALRQTGRATMLVSHEGLPYRYVSVEGPISISELGSSAHAVILELAVRYLGEELGTAYAATNWALDDVMVSITPERWRTEVLG